VIFAESPAWGVLDSEASLTLMGHEWLGGETFGGKGEVD
jgi:hypothetical protein